MPYKDPEKQKESRRKAAAKRRANPELRAKDVEYNKVWRKEHPRGYNPNGALAVRKHVLRKNGWTLGMIETTAAEQGDRCMICRKKPKPMGPLGGTGGLVPDHVHTDPPQPRALLCHNCNAALGLFKDSPETCRAAAEYLEAWS